ncbi:DUF397 domain-containing protein [Amycolatopsis orientalis]|uniref:DUF397 domain-containing protein n=1 Tax=Amycolatopsis orientalis TaxID=31958 RepID=UPI00040267F4|nr:DUF397 domain-containing protein [Amycolatopsis orientalis]
MASWDDRLPAETDFARLTWVKSSYSNDDKDCVEVAVARAMVFVRDSKAPEPMLGFAPVAWKTFIDGSLGS